MKNYKVILIICIPFLLSHLYTENIEAHNEINTDSTYSEKVKNTLPYDWNEYELTNKEKQSSHSFHILLRHNPNSLNELENLLLNVSNPNHEQYGNYLDRDEILDLLVYNKREQQIKNQLTDWLKVSGFYCEDFHDAFSCEGSISGIEKVFNIRMSSYYHPEYTYPHISMSSDSKGFVFREPFNELVQLVLGIADFPPTEIYNGFLRPKITSIYNDTDGYITSYGLHHLYKITHPVDMKTTQAPAEFLNDNCVSQTDLNQFTQEQNLPNITLDESNVIGNPCDFTTEYPDIEASLDLQYQLAVNPMANEYYVNVQNWMYAFATELFNYDNPPLVVSMSWGWAENDQCDPYVFPTGCLIHGGAEEYSKRTSVEFMKLSLRGVTLIASSGDAGAPGRRNEGCISNHPLNPVFPTSSPWVFSVGGTFVNQPVFADPNATDLPKVCTQYKCIVGGNETVAHVDDIGWTSGGGFSDFFERPWWQVNASEHYLNSSVVKPPSSYYNKNGRVYPDVTLVAHNYLTVIEGGHVCVDGTSASGPSFAGMVSRWNALLQSQGKPSLGALGPLFYQIAEKCADCFTDLVTGNNHATENVACNSSYGYTATSGYDPVYGLGLPNFDRVYEFLQAMN